MEMYNPNNNPFSTEPDDESEGNTQEEVNEENKKETGSKKKDKEITPKNNFEVDQMINSNISNLDDFLSKLEQFNNDWENEREQMNKIGKTLNIPKDEIEQDFQKAKRIKERPGKENEKWRNKISDERILEKVLIEEVAHWITYPAT